MTTSRPVVIGVSGEQPTAIRYAIAEAERHRTSLRVVHCYSLPLGSVDLYAGSDFMGTMRSAAEQTLAGARKLIESADPGCAVTYVTIEGEARAVLLAEAGEAESVVLGADEPVWLGRMLGGLVARRVARRAGCPVVVVPEQSAEPAREGAVVVTVDGDTSAAGPLSYGFDQADSRGAILVVLHAVPVGTSDADFDSHRANIAEVLAGWGALYPHVRVLVSSTIGDAVDTSISATASAALVVIGRPHGGDRSFALARPVAMQVLRKAQCPVAIVPTDYRRNQVNGSTHVGRRSTAVSWR